MALSTLLTRPIILIPSLCIVLLGLGVLSPSRASQTSIRTYTTPISSVRTMPVTQATAPTVTIPISTSPAILKHYAVPAGLRGDEGRESGDDGD